MFQSSSQGGSYTSTGGYPTPGGYMPIPPLPTTGTRKSSSLSPPGKRKNLPPPGSPRKLSPSRKLTATVAKTGNKEDEKKNALKSGGKLKPLPKIETKEKQEKKSKQRTD